eukprot:snap_masked-scaffold_45-processed-gene-1.43-mRNA-1 protein AED:1.00 eAED:1.00 QI:0/-1/0/0/-1/1/1/0/88
MNQGRRVLSTFRGHSVLRQQKRGFMDAPNKIGESQKIFQRGETPYLRGEADPTYWRKSSDTMVNYALFAACIGGWVSLGVMHLGMWFK